MYLWEAAAGDGENAIVVLQIGNTLHFYLTDGEAVSDDHFDTLDISTFLPSGSTETTSTVECQFAAGKGFLFVAHPFLDSFYCTYDPDAASVSAIQISPQVRDFEGVDDGLETNERPAALTEAHEYNLLNQGWDTDVLDISGGGTGYPLTVWEGARADEPSNADAWFFYVIPSSGLSFSLLEKDFGNSPRPKGHFILDYYNQDRNAVTPVETARTLLGLTSTTSGTARSSTIAFFAGRVWYAGCKGAGYSNRILFSQIIERDAQIGECYQQNDPTSQDFFDLLPSDGGTILIPDSGTIVKLFAFEDSILVFATNGVWKIAGSEGIGFRANDYSVVKMSSIPTLSASSFVSISGTPSFWNTEGIYTMQPSEAGVSTIVSITDTSIKAFLDDIPHESKKYVRGIYNRSTRLVTWVYRSTEPDTITERYSYDGVLNLNTLSGAFYPWTVDTSDVTIKGVLVALAQENEANSGIVTNNALATVTNAALETVYAFDDIVSQRTTDVTKFVVSYDSTVTFADEWNTAYLDWYSYDTVGVNYVSDFTTGYKVHGDGQRKPQPTYINLFFDTNDVDSSVDFRSVWQYATSGSTGRYSTAQRVVTDGNNYAYSRKRLKSRGSGVAYQFQVTSVAGEPFNLIGWSVFETITGNV